MALLFKFKIIIHRRILEQAEIFQESFKHKAGKKKK